MKYAMIVLLGLVAQTMAESPDKTEFNYTQYATILKKVDAKGLVNYHALKQDPEQLNHFRQSLSTLKREDYEGWSKDEQLAFWINAYNGLTLAAIVDHYPIKPNALKSLAFPKNSILQIKGV